MCPFREIQHVFIKGMFKIMPMPSSFLRPWGFVDVRLPGHPQTCPVPPKSPQIKKHPHHTPRHPGVSLDSSPPSPFRMFSTLANFSGSLPDSPSGRLSLPQRLLQLIFGLVIVREAGGLGATVGA